MTSPPAAILVSVPIGRDHVLPVVIGQVAAPEKTDPLLPLEATPERVWPVLTDTAAWPDWDSGVTKVDGRLALGEKLSISVEANSGRALPVKVVKLNEPERMVFRGGMPLGLFTGQRTYTLDSEGTRTRFTMREEYTGPLAGMIFKSIPDLGPSFRQFAEGLKQRAE